MTTTFLKIFPDQSDFYTFAAELFRQKVLDAVQTRDRFLIALSGGGTPIPLYQLLAHPSNLDTLPWKQMYFFWGDERLVPPQDAESNYYQAYSAFLKFVPVPPENIFRIKGEHSPTAAASDYAKTLSSFAEKPAGWPRFDLVFLGLGTDGHTASLFPGSELTSGVAVIPTVAKYQDRPSLRISLTPDVINDARNVAFLVKGQEKAEALAATLLAKADLIHLPARRISPTSGTLWWLLDSEAASLLPASAALGIIQL